MTKTSSAMDEVRDESNFWNMAGKGDGAVADGVVADNGVVICQPCYPRLWFLLACGVVKSC